MDHVKMTDIPVSKQAGCDVFSVFGHDGYIHADDATQMYCHSDAAMDKQPPHRHGAEVNYIVATKNAVCRAGKDKEALQTYAVSADDTLYMGPGDWHCFEFTAPDGFVDYMAFSSSGLLEIEE